MHPATGSLQELQRIDQLIATLQADLATLPKRMREAEAKLVDARSAVETAKQAHVQAIAQRRKFEFEVDQWKDRAQKYRSQSASVKTNEAYKALQHEISNAEAEVCRAEDRVLGQMMAVEEVERGIKHVEADFREAEQAINLEKKQIAAQFKEEKQRMEAAASQRAEIVKRIPQDLYELYSRIAAKYVGFALAAVRDGQCRGCGMRVLPHTIQLLKHETNEEVFRCETCGRILYTLEPVTSPVAPKQVDDASPDTPLS